MQNPECSHEGYFYFDPEDPIYADHFPGRPVVPGSLIIDAFVTAARPAKARLEECLIENFRFRQFISPGRYAFRMERKADGRTQCCLYDQGKVVVTGTLWKGKVPSSKSKVQG
jgi:3-hydroxyacyl-[acyl-carrier-protein] dehydratase